MEQQKYAQLSETNPVLYAIGVISFILIFLFLAGFLNFISTLYSDIDISKIDLYILFLFKKLMESDVKSPRSE